MFRSLVRALSRFGALTAFAAPAHAQSEVGGKALDLGFATQDLSFTTQPLVFSTLGLTFSIETVAGTAQATVATTQDLQVRETATEIRIELAADVLFDFDKDTIKPEAATALHSVAAIVNDRGKGRRIRIDGYTDSKGSAAYNQKLSERRADAVKLWLTQKERLPQANISTNGFGARNPVAPNAKPDGSDDPVGRQKNRRVVIVLAK